MRSCDVNCPVALCPAEGGRRGVNWAYPDTEATAYCLQRHSLKHSHQVDRCEHVGAGRITTDKTYFSFLSFRSATIYNFTYFGVEKHLKRLEFLSFVWELSN